MKKHLVLIGMVAALAATAVPSFAQTARPTPNPAMRAQFQQMRTQMRQIHTAERSQILGALTPAHRSLLASIAGQIATSVTPDFKGAASRLDSALSSGEKQAILNAAQNARTKQRSLMSSVHPEHARRNGSHAHRTPDAGALLLRLTLSGPHMGHGPMRR